jgi:hypothetical protein
METHATCPEVHCQKDNNNHGRENIVMEDEAAQYIDLKAPSKIQVALDAEMRRTEIARVRKRYRKNNVPG